MDIRMRIAPIALLLLAGILEGCEKLQENANPSASSQQQSKIQFDLSERCGNLARKVFEGAFGKSGINNTPDGQSTSDFSNHYNNRLNKCFYLKTYRDVPHKKQLGGFTLIQLSDLNDNKEIGSYFKGDNNNMVACIVAGKPCQSAIE